jgi:hypothetical protein
MFVYLATVERVVDGDTLDLDIDLGFKSHTRVRVRLLGVDTSAFVAATAALGVGATVVVGKDDRVAALRLPYVGRMREAIISVARAYQSYSDAPGHDNHAALYRVIEEANQVVREEKRS